MSITSLGYLGIGATDLDAWERYATEIIGMEASHQDGADVLHLRVDEHHHRVAVTPGDDDLLYVGWEVPTSSALDELAGRLEQADVSVEWCNDEEAARRRVSRLFRYCGPDGLPAEAFTGPLVSCERPFKPSRAISGFKTGPLGLGHIVVPTQDLGRSVDFYRHVLDFRVSDYIDFPIGPGMVAKLAFLRCNPRHHSIAFIDLALPKRIQHFMVEVNQLDDVGRAYEICLDRGIPIAMTLGRHSNDHMLSFYAENPSGFEVEYGWGGLLVDEPSWSESRYEVASLWGHRRVPAGSSA
jgi:2,3-dihydroxybiphenyl 1,2-dioxygenase